MGLDIRIPLGLIFLIIGGIISVFGLVSGGDQDLYARSLGVNLNLAWGLIMVVFGAVMFVAGRMQKWQDDPVSPRPWEREGGSKRGH